MIKEMDGCDRLYLSWYIDDFMLRVNKKVTRESAYHEIIKDIAKFYRPDNDLNIKGVEPPLHDCEDTLEIL
ncbi:unnamed protein product [Brachionus calyciflorus]|uniref:Uncharacterized protein n=1 Tax=Brachionus calyciflorus TaxID=104777 RepID=A0A814I819_9BILA|nr:unnamed protein product [Brachionus calyciflorus]